VDRIVHLKGTSNLFSQNKNCFSFSEMENNVAKDSIITDVNRTLKTKKGGVQKNGTLYRPEYLCSIYVYQTGLLE